MTPPRLSFAIATTAIFLAVAAAPAQYIQRSSYNPYGGNTLSSGASPIPGLNRPAAVGVGISPFGPTIGYATPFGYVIQPYFPSIPYFFGSGYGSNANRTGSRSYGAAYMQGAADSMSSSRVQGNAGDFGGRQDSGVKQDEGKPIANNNRRRFDQFLDEQNRRPKGEDAPAVQQRQLLLHSLANPGKQELSSGAAMNTILESLEQMRGRFKDAPEMPLEEDLLKTLNFTKGGGTGSFGLLRHGGKLPWTAGLLSLSPKDESDELRTTIEKGFQEAYSQAGDGNADADALKQLQRDADQLSDLVSANIRNMDLKDYMDAKRFLKSLDDTVTFLKQPDAGDWLPGKSKIKPKTIQELVHIMSEKRIRFAPALIGNDNAYAALHRMLVQLHTAVGPAPPAKP